LLHSAMKMEKNEHKVRVVHESHKKQMSRR